MHFSVGRTDVVARGHTIVKKVLVLVIGVAGYFNSKFVLSSSMIVATVSARFLRTTLSHAIRRYDRQVYREEEARRLLGIGRGLLAVFQRC